MKAIEDHRKQLTESNEFIKRYFIMDRDSTALDEKHYLLKQNLMIFRIWNIKINADNLIYNHKTEGKSSKDFTRYQNPIDIFINLSDGNVNPREVLKNWV